MKRERGQRAQVPPLYRAPAALALFLVSLVLGLLASGQGTALEDSLLSLDSPTLRGFLISHLFHVDGAHLGADILVLVLAGSVLEARWGTLRFLAFYLVCVWGTASVALLGAGASPAGGVSSGASGAALGSLLALGLLYPEHRVVRLAPPAKYLVWALIFLGATGLLLLEGRPVEGFGGFHEEEGGGGPGRGGPAPVLAVLHQVTGVAFALLVISLEPWRARVAATWRKRRETERRERLVELRRRVDQLLAKISDEGAESLTRDERTFLERASKHYRSDRKA
jgi:membrane associated rhomboid family serine protease